MLFRIIGKTFIDCLNHFSRKQSFKFIPKGINPLLIDKNIIYEKGSIYFRTEMLKLNYIITGNEKKKKNNDLIFFFHGVGRNENQWLDKNGFGKQFIKISDEIAGENIPVVSISFGMAFLLINRVPAPFSADLENLFINKIIPIFQKKLNRYGNIYLIGHSMGGFSAISLALRHPDLFKLILAISPFILTTSPFYENYDADNEELRKAKLWSKMLKSMLTYIFTENTHWKNYDPFYLINTINQENSPLLIISKTDKELEGFSYAINQFKNKLDKRSITNFYIDLEGNHHVQNIKPVLNIFINKIKEISMSSLTA